MSACMTRTEAVKHLADLGSRRGVTEEEVVSLSIGCRALLKRRFDWCRNRARKAEAARIAAGDSLAARAERLEGGLSTPAGAHLTAAGVVLAPPWTSAEESTKGRADEMAGEA